MRSRPLMTLRLGTAPTQKVGEGPHGTRLIFPIVGGGFEGDRLRGKVLPGGGDWNWSVCANLASANSKQSVRPAARSSKTMKPSSRSSTPGT